MDKARVVIADDHVLVREGLRKLLELDSNIEVIDEVGDGQGAINIARKEKPDIIIMDVNMPGTVSPDYCPDRVRRGRSR